MPKLVQPGTNPNRPVRTEAYVDYWGCNRLKRWRQDVVEATKLPEPSKTFLRNVGLPLNPLYFRDYLTWSDTLPVLPYPRPVRVLATVHGDPVFLLDEERGGSVVRLTRGLDNRGKPNRQTTECYANSSVEQFAECLTAHDEKGDILYDDPSYQRKVTALWRRFKDIDRTAIADRDSLWSMWIFDARILC